MPNKLKAKINNKILKWARTECNMTEEYVAEKLKISITTLECWEIGEEQPTIAELRELATLYRQLLAVFYMSKEPISTKQKFTDYRTISNSSECYEMSPELTFEVREAIYNRNNMIELKSELEEEIDNFDIHIKQSEKHKDIYNYIIQKLNIDFNKVYALKNINEKFNYYRNIMENNGIIVYQAKETNIKEMRGMALYFDKLPIIILNRKDSYTARIFSIFHELIHLTLRTSSLCDMIEDVKNNNDNSIEFFCNSIAGEILVPEKVIIENLPYDENKIKKIASRQGISKDVFIRRLFDLKIISFDEYINKLSKYKKEFEEIQKKKKSSGFVSPVNDTVSVVGKNYTRTVLKAYNENKITFNEISEYLNIKLKHYDNLITKVIIE